MSKRRARRRGLEIGICVACLALVLTSGCAAPGDRDDGSGALTAAEQRLASREEVLREREERLSSDHFDVQSARVDLAMSLVELGRLEEAGPVLDRALVVLSITTTPAHPLVWRARSWRARVALAGGDAPLARLLLGSVVVELEQALPPDHPDLVDARAKLAQAVEASAGK